jgi:glutamate-1-semialdehyde 2,1-aminomutase
MRAASRQASRPNVCKPCCNSERNLYVAAQPALRALAGPASQHLLFGVPLHWMNDWATPFALHMATPKART